MEFTIKKTRYGLYTSVTPDGTELVTGLTEDGVQWVTVNIHIPVLQGTFDGYTSECYAGKVEGKL